MNAIATQPVSSSRPTSKLALLAAAFAAAACLAPPASAQAPKPKDPIAPPSEMMVPDFRAPMPPLVHPPTIHRPSAPLVHPPTISRPSAPLVTRPPTPAVASPTANPISPPVSAGAILPGKALSLPVTDIWDEHRSADLIRRVNGGAKAIVFYTGQDPDGGFLRYRQVLGYESKGTGPDGRVILAVQLGTEYVKYVGPWVRGHQPPFPLR